MSQRHCASRAGFAAIFVGVVTLLFTVGCGRSGLDADELFGELGPGGMGAGGVGAGGVGAGGVGAGGLTGRGGSAGGTLNTGGRRATGGFGNAGAGGIGNGGANAGGRAPGGAGGVSTGGRAPGGAGGVSTGGSMGTGGSPATGGSPSSCASTCSGCCDAAGDCEPGDSANACGASGARCLDCGSSGFGCVNSVCHGPPPVCSPANCDGCCDSFGRCRDGDDTEACGNGGRECSNCTSHGTLGCSAGTCSGPAPPCGPPSCGGCCKAGDFPDERSRCVSGDADYLCGSGGGACSNCAASGRKCNQPGSYCTFVPACNATTCPDGCCDANGTCRDGREDAACGVSGQECQDCSGNGQQCAAAGFCYTGPHCGPDNCGGCCTANGQCVAGAGNARCGRFGALCDNCASQGETCQNGACGAAGATCPAPYGGCNPGVLTSPPPTSTSCAAADLAALASACNGPRASAACRAELASLLRASPGCFDCLQPFLNPAGVGACLAPFLNSTCNHDLTCSLACTNVACGSCPAGETEGCQDQAFTASGSCRAYVNGNYCAIAAFGGPGAFCDLERIGDVGVWLQGVGAYYCSR